MCLSLKEYVGRKLVEGWGHIRENKGEEWKKRWETIARKQRIGEPRSMNSYRYRHGIIPTWKYNII